MDKSGFDQFSEVDFTVMLMANWEEYVRHTRTNTRPRIEAKYSGSLCQSFT